MTNLEELFRKGLMNLLDVTERRTHHVGRNSKDILDDLLAPSELGNDFLVGQSGE